MIVNVNNYKVNVIENPTKIYGLKFEPQLEEKYDNDADIAYFHRGGFIEVSQKNYNLMETLSKKYLTHGVMEIGVSRNGEGSFTKAILNNKPDNIPYLGIDLEDKSYLDNIHKNIFTLKEDSFNQSSVRDYAKLVGIEKISLFFIDGWHSVNAVINDWKYTDMLADNAIVVFHDTNHHPGPVVILPAINEKLFKVETFFKNEPDYGMAVAYKL